MHITCISSYYYKSCWNKLKCEDWKKREEEKQRNSQSARFTPWRLFIMGIRGIIGQHTFPHSTQSKWAAGVALAITTMAIIMCILVALAMMIFFLYIKHMPNILALHLEQSNHHLTFTFLLLKYHQYMCINVSLCI